MASPWMLPNNQVGGFQVPAELFQTQQQALSPQEKEEFMRQQDLVDKLVNKQRQATGAAIEQQRQTLGDLKQRHASPEVDWTGSTMLVDHLMRISGKPSNLTQQYMQSSLRPESEKQRIKGIQDTEKQIADAERRLMGEEVKLARDKLQTMKNSHSAADTRAQRNRISAHFQQARLNESLSKEINTRIDKEVRMGKDFDDYVEKLANLEDNLQPDARTGKLDFQKLSANAANFARTISGEKGVLTDTDITRIFPQSGAKTIAELEAWFSKTPTADLPKDFANRMNEMIMTAKRNLVKTRMKALDEEEAGFRTRPNYKEFMAAPNPNNPQGGWGTAQFQRKRESLQQIFPEWDKPLPWEEAPQAAPGGGLSDEDINKMSAEELRKYLGG